MIIKGTDTENITASRFAMTASLPLVIFAVKGYMSLDMRLLIRPNLFPLTSLPIFGTPIMLTRRVFTNKACNRAAFAFAANAIEETEYC